MANLNLWAKVPLEAYKLRAVDPNAWELFLEICYRVVAHNGVWQTHIGQAGDAVGLTRREARCALERLERRGYVALRKVYAGRFPALEISMPDCPRPQPVPSGVPSTSSVRPQSTQEKVNDDSVLGELALRFESPVRPQPVPSGVPSTSSLIRESLKKERQSESPQKDSRAFELQVIALFGELCPGFPQPQDPTHTKAGAMLFRAIETISKERKLDLDGWRGYFAEVNQATFIREKRYGLDWFCKSLNYDKTIQGRYRQRADTARPGNVEIIKADGEGRFGYAQRIKESRRENDNGTA